MDEKQFAKRDFHVGGASGSRVTTDFLGADYQLSEPKRDVATGSTGCLELFRIDPIHADHGLPAFRVRIGHDDHEAVDVDLLGPEAECRAFAKAAPGYLGHKVLKTSPRSFRLDIAVPSGVSFPERSRSRASSWAYLAAFTGGRTCGVMRRWLNHLTGQLKQRRRAVSRAEKRGVREKRTIVTHRPELPSVRSARMEYSGIRWDSYKFCSNPHLAQRIHFQVQSARYNRRFEGNQQFSGILARVFAGSVARSAGGKMVRIFIPFFYVLGASLDAIKGVQTGTDVVTVWSALYSAQQNVDATLSTQWFAPAVKAAYGPGTRLVTALKALTENPDFSKPRAVNPVEAYHLSQALSEFETVLRNELENADTYFVTRKGAYDTSVLITNAELMFSQDLPIKVKAAIPDVREAGKCLAFELPTASGFHMMRSVESVLRSYWSVVANGRPEPPERNLGVYLRTMDHENLGSEKVRAALRQLKDLHRNPLIHPEIILSLDEAVGLFGMAQSVVNAMLKEIPDSANLPATAPLPGV